ncbi:hypothetical protein HJFPF1_05996 [Paramyrothecium foliicola]|nr:hypothetical protein HJFPF1_05996 [Paramyrothecium foliicola]
MAAIQTGNQELILKRFGELDVLELLLDAGPGVTQSYNFLFSSNGRSALQSAAEKQYAKIPPSNGSSRLFDKIENRPPYQEIDYCLTEGRFADSTTAYEAALELFNEIRDCSDVSKIPQAAMSMLYYRGGLGQLFHSADQSSKAKDWFQNACEMLPGKWAVASDYAINKFPEAKSESSCLSTKDLFQKWFISPCSGGRILLSIQETASDCDEAVQYFLNPLAQPQRQEFNNRRYEKLVAFSLRILDATEDEPSLWDEWDLETQNRCTRFFKNVVYFLRVGDW